MFARLLVVVTLIASTAGLAACTNTAKGLGRDINNNGQATKKAVQGH